MLGIIHPIEPPSFKKRKSQGVHGPLAFSIQIFAPALPLDKAGAYGIINIKRALPHGG
jgi:hypothetical protein